MGDNTSKDKQQSESISAGDHESATENTAENQQSTIGNNPTENASNHDSSNKNKTNLNKTKIKLPKIKNPGIKFNFSGIKNIYENQYKKLLIMPFALLLIAILLIGFQFATTGDFINRDVSLKGGVTVTIPTSLEIDILQLKEDISSRFPENDISTKSLSRFGTPVGVIIEADIEENRVNELINGIGKALNQKLTSKDYSVEIVGSSLGASFFKEIIIALLTAFLFMAVVVFLYFRTFVPSAAVILSAFSDIIVTLAIVNLLDIRLSAAGIAAFLMLIGYSVDTDILLTTRLLKRKEGTEMERIYGAIDTGFTMTLTTLVAVIVGLIFTQSDAIRQIMIILLIGLLVDMIYTWIQNAGILRLYLEKKAKKSVQ